MQFTALSKALLATLSLVSLPGTFAQTIPCDPIEKYTTSWFLGNVCKRPPAATCLFYTRGLSLTAKRFSKANGADMTTIWEMWARPLYRNAIVSNNPLRCIMQDKTLRRQYFAAMSESMAIMCDVFATVMDPNPSSPREDGIWGQVELPTLQRSGNEGCVTSIAGTSPDGKEVHNLWSRPGMSCAGVETTLPETTQATVAIPPPATTALSESSRKLRMRMARGVMDVVQARQEDCGIESDDVAAQFDVGGEFEVEW
ncbi:hypothetical protein V8F20_009880 [Naviculisporaceae sp. PSN 640]